MPVQVNINPPPDCLPDGWERPKKPEPRKACILRFDYGLRYPDACYWSGYEESTAATKPKRFLQNGDAQQFLEERGISVTVMTVETVNDVDAVLERLRPKVLAGDGEKWLETLREYREQLRFRCQVGGVPLHHTVVTGGKNKEGSDQPIIIRIEQGCGE